MANAGSTAATNADISSMKRIIVAIVGITLRIIIILDIGEAPIIPTTGVAAMVVRR
jgi:hypothetical protein